MLELKTVQNTKLVVTPQSLLILIMNFLENELFTGELGLPNQLEVTPNTSQRKYVNTISPI